MLDPFLAPKSEPGTSKIIEILATVVKNQGFAILSLDRFRTSIWDPPGLLLEGIWPPGNAETSLLSGLGPSKSRFQLLFWAPKASKSAPRAFQEASKRPPGCQDNSKSSARGPRVDFRPDLKPVWARISSRFGAILNAESGTETREQSRAESRAQFGSIVQPKRPPLMFQEASSKLTHSNRLMTACPDQGPAADGR